MPVLRLLATALAPAGAFDPSLFINTLAKPATLRAALRTLDTSFFGAIAALVLGGAVALLVTLTDLGGRRPLSFLFLLPLMIAPQVTALAWLHVLAPSSVLLGAFGLAPAPGTPNPLLGRGGIILLFGVQHAAIVFVTIRAGLVRLPRDLSEAARSSGARPARVVATIVVPLMRPFIVAAFALAFVSGTGNFGIPALLGSPVGYETLTTLLYQRLSSYGPEVLPDVAGLSIAVTLLASVGIWLQSFALGGKSRRVAIGKPVQFALGRWHRLATGLAWAVVAVVLILPGVSLLATALVPAFGVRLDLSTVTLGNFAEVFFVQAATARAFRNSFLFAGSAAVILGFVALFLARGLAAMPRPLRQLAESVTEFPYAMPGIALAVACILIFLRPLPLIGSLYGTGWIILAAYLMHFSVLALKPVTAAFEQMPRDLDEAAASCGAGMLRRLATIAAPIAAPAGMAGAVLVFMSAFNELTVSALLWSSGHETLGVTLFSLEEAGLGPQAAAIAVSTILAVVLLLAAIDRLGRRLPVGVLPWR